MKLIPPRIFLLLAPALLASILSCSRNREGVAPGDYAPSFRLQKLEGGEVSLTDFRGKTVLLNFWASWCAPCIAEMPELDALTNRLGAEQFAVITIAEEEGRQELLDFRDKYNLTLPILLDKKGDVRRSYGVTGFPETFLLDANGKVQMLQDPSDGQSRVRLKGPREWLSPSVLSLLRRYLPKK